MAEYRVEITDSKGSNMKILIRLPVGGRGTWDTLDNGYFCYEKGVADTGHYPTSSLAWVALYGGRQVDDSKLVLHLDDFLGFTQVNSEGKGRVYEQDYLTMKPGEVKWRLSS